MCPSPERALEEEWLLWAMAVAAVMQGPPQLALKLSPSICSLAENKNAVLELKSFFTFSEMWFKHF